MVQFQIRPAVRKRLNARLGLCGPSGGGKTMGALLIARGLVSPDGEIIVLDTEQESSAMYAGLEGVATEAQPEGFSTIDMQPPYSPKNYMQAIDAAEAHFEKRGVPLSERALIIDQISHAWTGPGGVLEFVDNAKTSTGTKAGFNAWKEATPMQNAFVERMLRFKGHLIVTMRVKTEYVIEKDDRGLSVPRKIGLQPVQRDNVEYEFQVIFDVNEGGHAHVSKDRTNQFMGTSLKPSVEIGARYRKYLLSGAELVPQATKPEPSVTESAGNVSVIPEDPPDAHQSQDDRPAPPDAPAEECISQAQAKILFAAGKNAGLSAAAIKDVVKRICGVDKSAEIPQSKYMAVLSAIVPEEPAA